MAQNGIERTSNEYRILESGGYQSMPYFNSGSSLSYPAGAVGGINFIRAVRII